MSDRCRNNAQRYIKHVRASIIVSGSAACPAAEIQLEIANESDLALRERSPSTVSRFLPRGSGRRVGERCEQPIVYVRWLLCRR